MLFFNLCDLVAAEQLCKMGLKVSFNNGEYKTKVNTIKGSFYIPKYL